jgi:hypothetical protein
LALSLLAVGCSRAQESSQHGRPNDIDASARPPSTGADAVALTSSASADAAADVAREAAPADDGAASWVATAVPVPLRPNDPCLLNCRKRASELHCGKGEGCQDACAKLRGAKFCASEVNAFIACFLKQQRFQWGCVHDLPVLTGDVCDQEQAGVSDCLMRTGGKL